MESSPHFDKPGIDPEAVAGFSTIERGGPFFHSLGHVYQQRLGDYQVVLGLRLGVGHINANGNPHGGMLMTLADSALTANLELHYPPEQKVVTVSLSSSFMATAGVGDWIEAHVRVTRNGRTAGFADCDIVAAERVLLHASAVFSVIRPKGC